MLRVKGILGLIIIREMFLLVMSCLRVGKFVIGMIMF